MTTLDKEVGSGEFFYYKRGNVETYFPWNRPSYEEVESYLEYVRNESSIMDDFEVYLRGGVLYDFDTTWDVDICIVNQNASNEKIEEALNYLTDTGLNKFFLLVDPIWFERRPQDMEYSKLEESNFLAEDILHKKIGYIKKSIGNESTEYDPRLFPNAILLSEHLIEGNYGNYQHQQKIIDKVRDNKNPVTITTFSVEDFLLNDKDYFLQNTNR
jgi:hypothetical protein